MTTTKSRVEYATADALRDVPDHVIAPLRESTYTDPPPLAHCDRCKAGTAIGVRGCERLCAVCLDTSRPAIAMLRAKLQQAMR
jgi:hypothetical protein